MVSSSFKAVLLPENTQNQSYIYYCHNTLLMKNISLTWILLVSFLAVQAQKPVKPDLMHSLDKFVPGDAISKYGNAISPASQKDSAKTLRRYLYTGNDVKTFLGYPIKRISLEFCSGTLVAVSFQFGDQAPQAKNTFTRMQLDELKTKLVQRYGSTKMHNNTDMAIDDSGRGGLSSESWAWTNKKMFLSLLWMKTMYDKGYSAGLSLMDRELRKNCVGK